MFIVTEYAALVVKMVLLLLLTLEYTVTKRISCEIRAQDSAFGED